MAEIKVLVQNNTVHTYMMLVIYIKYFSHQIHVSVYMTCIQNYNLLQLNNKTHKQIHTEVKSKNRFSVSTPPPKRHTNSNHMRMCLIIINFREIKATKG